MRGKIPSITLYVTANKLTEKHYENLKMDAFNGPYFNSKLELKSNSSEILPVRCKFICESTST